MGVVISELEHLPCDSLLCRQLLSPSLPHPRLDIIFLSFQFISNHVTRFIGSQISSLTECPPPCLLLIRVRLDEARALSEAGNEVKLNLNQCNSIL